MKVGHYLRLAARESRRGRGRIEVRPESSRGGSA